MAESITAMKHQQNVINQTLPLRDPVLRGEYLLKSRQRTFIDIAPQRNKALGATVEGAHQIRKSIKSSARLSVFSNVDTPRVKEKQSHGSPTLCIL